ncbi:MAG: TRAP transporter small permease [Allorhizobium sp.]
MNWARGLTVIERASRFLIGITFFILMGSVMIQVLGRSVFFDSPVWTEELTRFALLYIAALGLGPAYRSGDLVNVDLICEALPGRLPWVMRLVSAAATAFLALMLMIPAWTYTSIGAFQTSPALGWRMDLIHASMLTAMVSLFIFSAARILGMLTGAIDGSPHHLQDEL